MAVRHLRRTCPLATHRHEPSAAATPLSRAALRAPSSSNVAIVTHLPAPKKHCRTRYYTQSWPSCFHGRRHLSPLSRTFPKQPSRNLPPKLPETPQPPLHVDLKPVIEALNMKHLERNKHSGSTRLKWENNKG
ncbi:hypothetical protein SESBI_24617 [Sesbania bispinosa]|nr:hypothetical protein SESBI_24617 [Sesbania bispinosa]